METGIYRSSRIGLAKACTKIQGQFTSGTSGISQRAAIAAISSSPRYCLRNEISFLKKKRLCILTDALSKIDGIRINKPQGAFYVFPDISASFSINRLQSI